MADSKKAGRKASKEFQKESFDAPKTEAAPAGNKTRDATDGHSVQKSSQRNRASGEKANMDKAPQTDSFFDDGSKAGRTESGSNGKSRIQREFQGREREKIGRELFVWA